MPIYQMPDGGHADIPEDADPVLLKKLWDSYQPPQVGRDSQSINASLEDKDFWLIVVAFLSDCAD